MDWFSGSKQTEAKKWLPLLADATRRDRAAQELIRLGDDAVPVLIDALQTQDLSLLLLCQQILARIPSASPVLIKALSTAHPLVRGRVAEVFSINKEKAAVPALIEALHGQYFTVRARAALALAAMNETSAIPDLLLLLKDPEDEVRMAACKALGVFHDPSTFDELANIVLDDPKIEVRQAAVKALGESKNPAAIPFLMEALRDSFWWFEREAATRDLLSALEQMGEPIVLPLIEALGDREVTVRKFAAILLGNLRDPRALEELGMALYDLHHEVSRAAAEALGQIGTAAINVLTEALTHPEASVREHAVLGLNGIQDARVTPFLISMLTDPDRNVRRQAILSLGSLRDERASAALREVSLDRSDRELGTLAKQLLEANQ